MYTTKENVKKFTGLNFTSTMDTFIDTLIAAAQSYIERYCGDPVHGDRIFEAPSPNDDETRYFDGNGAEKLWVGDLFDITSVTIDNDFALTLDDDYFAYPSNRTTAWHYLEMTQPVTRLNSNSRISDGYYIWEVGQQNVEITGKFYYTETPPADIELATMQLVSAMIKQNVADGDTKEVKSETFDDYQVSYQEVGKIADRLGVNQILEQYRRTPDQSGHNRKAGRAMGTAGVMKI